MRTDLIILYGPRGEVVVQPSLLDVARANEPDWAAIVDALAQENPLLQDRRYVAHIGPIDLTEIREEKS